MKTKYKPPRRLANVSFDEDSEWHGAEMELYLDAPMSLLFEFQRLGSATGEDAESIMRSFGDHILSSWNLEEPANGEGMLAQSFNFGVAVIEAWGKAATQPGDPLVER